MSTILCECGHTKAKHADGGCSKGKTHGSLSLRCVCRRFKPRDLPTKAAFHQAGNARPKPTAKPRSKPATAFTDAEYAALRPQIERVAVAVLAHESTAASSSTS